MGAPRPRLARKAIGAAGLAALALLAAPFSPGCSRLPAPSPRAASVHERLSRGGCELWDDDQGIPHVRARDELSLYACFGYVHGRDRAWEMDHFRRVAQGRSAEVLGKGKLRADFLMRMLGLQERARRLYERLPEERQDLLLAYAEGATRGMSEAVSGGQYEFRELGYEPEPWRPEDTLAIVYLESFDQTRETFERQIDEQEWLASLGGDRAGAEVARRYREEGAPWDTTILKPGEYPRRASGAASARADGPGGQGSAGQQAELKYGNAALPASQDGNAPKARKPVAAPRLFEPREGKAASYHGSNNWVVSPARSATGRAWLANDPHLGLNRPAFWHWVHVTLEPGKDEGKPTGGEPSLDVIGASLPGMPVIVSGANRHVSWGLTNSYLPVARLGFVPESEIQGSARRSWPLIWVKLWKLRLPFFFESYRRTAQEWPVLPLEIEGAPKGAVPVLRWTGFDLDPAGVDGLQDIMGARTAAELDAAFARVGVPSWNFVFADERGHIGYRAVGRVPAFRGEPPPGVPIETLRGLHGPEAFPRVLAPAQMPHVLDPGRGYVVTANNRQWPNDSEFAAGDAQRAGFRAFRIEELLKKQPRHDLASLRDVQCDVQSVDARFLIPRMLEAMRPLADRLGDGERQALHIVASWDFSARLDCKACAISRRWIDRALEGDLNPAALYRALPGARPGSELLARLQGSLRGALADLGLKAASANEHVPQWGELHLNFFDHLAGEGRFSALAPIPTPGDDESVNPGSADWEGGRFRHKTGASERLIVELSSPPAVYSVLPGGERDTELRDLTAAGSPWQDWVSCRLRRRAFPLDWAQVPARPLRF